MAAGEEGDPAGTEVVLTNPALWLLDEAGLREALVVAAEAQLDLAGTRSIAQGVDPGMEARPPDGEAPGEAA